MKHGTVTAYVTYGCRCSTCKKGFRDYRNSYFKNNPDQKRAAKARARLSQRARTILVQRHPIEFREVYEELCAKEGL